MRIRYLLAIVLIVLFALPGTASQLAARAAATAPANAGDAFSDPNIEPSLSIQLPSRFVAPIIVSQPLQHFAG